MKKASITDAKNNFSALIDQVKAGSPDIRLGVRWICRRCAWAALRQIGIEDTIPGYGQLLHLPATAEAIAP